MVESLWARPETGRAAQVAAELVGAAVARFGGQDLHAMVRHENAAAYLGAGFQKVQEKSTKDFTALLRLGLANCLFDRSEFGFVVYASHQPSWRSVGSGGD